MTVFSCTRSPFQVHLEYISKEQLASYHVGTPDPRLVLMPVGQRVVIQWRLEEPIFDLGTWKIALYFRYKNQTEGFSEIFLIKSRGQHIFELADEQYFSTCGILAWKAELIKDDEVMLVKQHLLWTRLIEFEDPKVADEFKFD
ncbi:hypothetical protein [Criblamydia sequanensis]|uniref:Uncharacterized protein n=1 Tax=Candidatus Criblamydia sequanensis CRIB-18 TaxID=1437425 RepID=A0A090D210_9BACT|nr:hypothetical protein [Criblamydia sequanensis]CDR33958.1 Hypothetical protein CSEC_1132 [Criblamydia sequanensis CRIB-18]